MEAEAKIEYANLIKDLRNRKEVLQAKLEELKKASDEAWETVKVGVEKATADLREALQSALPTFKR